MSVFAAFILSVSGLFVPLGPERYISSTTANLPSTVHAPEVAIADDGTVVTAWTTEPPAGVDLNVVQFVIAYPPTGEVSPTESAFPVAAGTVYHSCSVAMAANGRFIIVAEREDTASGNRDIVARTFDRDGLPERDTFTVNAAMPIRDRTEPTVAMFANADFYIAWTEEFAPGDTDIYHAIWFNGETLPFSQFLAPTSLASLLVSEASPRISVDPGTVQVSPDEPSVVVCYSRPNANNGNTEFVAQRLTPGGTKIGAPIPFAAGDPSDDMSSGDVAMEDTGGFVAVWETEGFTWRRRFSAAGTPIGPGALDAGPGLPNDFHGTVRVSTGRDGDYLVAFSYLNNVIYAEYNADDSTRLASAEPDAVSRFRPSRPAVAVSRNGDFAAIAWQGFVGGSYPVFTRRFRRVGETVDSDGDGISDSFESMNNSNPADHTSRPAILDMNFDGEVNAADAIFWYRSMIGAPPLTVPSTP